MRTLFSFDYEGHPIEIRGTSWTGYEQLLVDGEVVSSKRNFAHASAHQFRLSGHGVLTLTFRIDGQLNQVCWRLMRRDEVLQQGAAVASAALERLRRRLAEHERSSAPAPRADDGSMGDSSRQHIAGSTDTAQRVANRASPSTASDAMAAPAKADNHLLGLVGMAFKLLKSGTALKVGLAGTAFAGWSVLFSWQLALLVIAVIVFHEYGHLRAMKRCGLETKGIYLIPFVGGVAVGSRPDSYWHEVYISMMGPVYGLWMSLAFTAAYMITGVPMFGLVASFSALINLFNLLPVYPLDGGHVLKAVTRSLSERHSWAALLAVSALGFAASAAAGLYLLSFFCVLGALDLLASQASAADRATARMSRLNAVASLLWMGLVIAAFVGVIWYMARAQVPGSEIPLLLLRD